MGINPLPVLKYWSSSWVTENASAVVIGYDIDADVGNMKVNPLWKARKSPLYQ